MKITRIDQFAPAPRTRLVRIATDSGIEGWAESTLEGKPVSVPAAVSEYADYLVGKDPLLIEHHWQQMYRSAFFRGGAHNMTAIAALDAALWDVAGKHYGVPSYALMGGKVRDRIRVYAHWGIEDLTDEGMERSRTSPRSPGQIRLHGLQVRDGTSDVSGPRAAVDNRPLRQVRIHDARVGGPRRGVVLRLSRQDDAGAGYRSVQ